MLRFLPCFAVSARLVLWFSGFAGDVKYTNDLMDNLLADGLMVGTGESVQQQIERSRDQHFLTKHPDWKGEGEFRLVVMTAEAGRFTLT
jgi:hypothetical protein